MSINAVSSQQPVYTPKSQAASSAAPVFTLEPETTQAEAPKAAPKTFNLTPVSSMDMQELTARWEKVRPEMEAREKAWSAVREGWGDYMKKAAAVANDQPYGQITKNGEVIATVYNSGAMSGTGATQIDPDHPAGMRGPELAKWRAEQIMKAAGGTFTGLDTAETQDGWIARQANNLPRMGLTEWAAANGYEYLFADRPYFNDVRS